MDAWFYNSISVLILLNLLLSLRNTYNLNEYRDLLYHILDHVCPIDEYGETIHEHDYDGSENNQIIILELDDSESSETNMSWKDWERGD